MIFIDKEHENFYNEKVRLLPNKDPYRESMFYVLGLMEETRNNFHHIYDENERVITPEDVFSKAWQTSATASIIRLGYNLYNGYHGDSEDTHKYAVDNIFQHTAFAPYFYEAIKIRFNIK